MTEKKIFYPGFIQLLVDTYYLDETREYELGHRNATIKEANERLRQIQTDSEQLAAVAGEIERILRELTAKQRQAIYLRYRLYDPPKEDEPTLHDFSYVGKYLGGSPIESQTASAHTKAALKNMRKISERGNGISGFRFERRRINY